MCISAALGVKLILLAFSITHSISISSALSWKLGVPLLSFPKLPPEQSSTLLFEELFELLKIPSISADSNYVEQVKQTALLVKKKLLDAGVDYAELCETNGHPIVFAEKNIIRPHNYYRIAQFFGAKRRFTGRQQFPWRLGIRPTDRPGLLRTHFLGSFMIPWRGLSQNDAIFGKCHQNRSSR